MSAVSQKQPREIKPQPKAYAFERSLGVPPAESVRRAGGKVENGQASKWEVSPRVQAWIKYYRSLGHTEEMLAAKRERIESELQAVALSNMDDFVMLVPTGTTEGAAMVPVLDLTRINAMSEMERRATMAAVKTVKYTENGPTFELHGKLDALNQLRDMHGLKAPTKVAPTNPAGDQPYEAITDADRARALALLIARVGAENAA